MTGALRWISAILIGLVVILLAMLAFRPRAVIVEVATVQRGTLRVTVDEEGRTRIRERYVVSSPLTGRLRRITLDPGDQVEADQTVLAVIEPADPTLIDARELAEAEGRVHAAEAGVHQAAATLEIARAAASRAERDLGRTTTAMSQGAANDSDMDKARTEQRQTKEALRAAQHGLEIAEYEAEVARSALLFASGDAPGAGRPQMPLTSPIDGVVLRVFQESVAVVAPGDALIEVGDPRDLEIVVDVLSEDAVKIRPGQRVIIDHWGGEEPLEGVVRLVEPSAFTEISSLGIDEQRVNVIVDFVTAREPRASLGDGFRVEASVVVWELEDTLLVPVSAVFRQGEQWALYLIEGGRARLRAVEIGRQNARLTEMISDLPVGAPIIVHPSDAVSDGARVKALPK